MTRHLPLLLAGGLLLLPAPSALCEEGGEGGICPSDDELLDGTATLRALSLDLRGVVPTPDEYALVGDDGTVPESVIDDWMATDAFAWRVVRHHRSLLWPNVTDIRLLSNRQRLIEYSGVFYRYLVAPNYRGGPIYCGDFEAEYDDKGELVLHETSAGYLQEGWVWVHPYWDMENPIKVCAFEAQETLVSPWGTRCDTYDGRYDTYCGCGPNLAWCDTPYLGHNGGNAKPPVAVSIAGDLEHRVHRVIDQDLSYLELLTGRTMFVNGPLTHFLRWQTQVPAHVRFNEVPVDPDILPDLDFSDADTWVELELGEEQAGVLTSIAYLMKFQTRRGRTNRFYNAFLCQPFQPPDGGLSDLDNPDASLDLTQRDGCSYCHALIEPAGAHWGRWVEYGAGYLDPADFDAYDASCAWCAESGESCSPECENYYVIDPLTSEEEPWVGWMKGYEFVEERHVENIEAGPRRLVNEAVADGRLPRCVAKNTATWLLGRELDDNDEAWLDDLAGTFTSSNYDYKSLVKAIVTSENYRRAR